MRGGGNNHKTKRRGNNTAALRFGSDAERTPRLRDDYISLSFLRSA